ncbi:MAG: peptidylprolyl isomerase [Campylobacterales bacterium]|nr:peptidylprolyl isomerase [Campylobacterales bacterium]
MKIGKNSIVTLDYSVTDVGGQVVDEGREPIIYIHGGYEAIFPKIEAALEGKGVGESIEVALYPEDSFGEYDDDLVEVAERSEFPDDLQIGMQFTQGDGEDSELYIVRDIQDGKVVLDANHPLAGLELVFACTVTAVRDANNEELAAAAQSIKQ